MGILSLHRAFSSFLYHPPIIPERHGSDLGFLSSIKFLILLSFQFGSLIASVILFHPRRTMATGTIKLFCFVLGDTSSFPVKVGRDDTVGDLKEAIVAKFSTPLPTSSSCTSQIFRTAVRRWVSLVLRVVRCYVGHGKLVNSSKVTWRI